MYFSVIVLESYTLHMQRQWQYQAVIKSGIHFCFCDTVIAAPLNITEVHFIWKQTDIHTSRPINFNNSYIFRATVAALTDMHYNYQNALSFALTETN